MTQRTNEILAQAKQLVRIGKKRDARILLKKFLEQNPDSEEAWWIMSFAVPDLEHQVQCLEKILQINPERQQARQKLEELTGVEPEVSRVSKKEKTPERDGKSKGKSPWRWIVPSLVSVVVIVSLILCFEFRKSSDSPLDTLAQANVPQSSPAQHSAGLPPTWTNPAPTLTLTPLPTLTETPLPTGTSTPDPNATRTPVPEARVGLRPGKYPPDFALKDVMTGELISIRDYAGQPVLMAFFATWCPYCKSDLPIVQGIYEDYRNEGFVVLGIGVNESTSSVRNFGSRFSLSFPLMADSSSTVADDYLIPGYPYYYFIDKNGKIGYVNRGLIKKDILISYLNKP